jgi:hypothetical protein
MAAFLLLATRGFAADCSTGTPVERIGMREEFEHHHVRGRPPETCSIAYYELCSGWIWTWSGYQVQYAVVFDLPNDCGKQAGQLCTNTGFWWYWRYTNPGYQIPVTYSLYAADSALCRVGAPIGTLPDQDPIERWNAYPGLGSTTSDFVAIVAISASFPMVATDNTTKNQAIGCAPIPTAVHSVLGFVSYCPPTAMEDGLGPCNLLVDGEFYCAATTVELSSWGAIKTLFR